MQLICGKFDTFKKPTFYCPTLYYQLCVSQLSYGRKVDEATLNFQYKNIQENLTVFFVYVDLCCQTLLVVNCAQS